ncbi:MAG TPA: hypothetical protein VLV83_24705 [Acidobacteriota bacterium]|nr:hypothetical protein [Acidobacteriota bacterium]
MTGKSETQKVVFAATLTAGAMIAHQLAGKAARDALFLSNYAVTSLPVMLTGSAIFSIAVVLLTSWLMTRLTPGRLIPAAFAASAVLQIGLWGVLEVSPRAAAVLFYLHVAAFGSILVSGFWSMFNERLDPRSARRHIARVAGGATLGGLIGGLVAERAAVYLTVSSMLPILAALHFFCAFTVQRLQLPEDEARAEPVESPASGLKLLRRTPYLRNLALLILMGTVTAALLDYVFKSWAEHTYQGGEPLLRFFALFYTGVGLLTFLVQTLLSKRSLEGLGLSRTVAVLPGITALGAGAVLAFPGLLASTLARGGEAVVRSSLFRSSYELFFTPIEQKHKRATKGIIDVGFERLGDALGGGLVFLLLYLGSQAHPAMMILAAALSLAGFLVCRRLGRGYVRALESSMANRAMELDLTVAEDRTTRTIMMQTMSSFDLGVQLDQTGPIPEDDGESEEEEADDTPDGGEEASQAAGEGSDQGDDGGSSESAPPADPAQDALLRQIADLRSGDAQRIRRVLRDDAMLDPQLTPFVIPLLAWDKVAGRAMQSLRNIAPQIQGQLLDALLDRENDFAIRRRLPRVLVFAPTRQVAEGLLKALEDQRFEVRFQAGRALAFIKARSDRVEFREMRVFKAVLREVDVDRRIWESQRLLDTSSEQGAPQPSDDDSLIVDELLRERTTRSMEHVFTLLSLCLPREPLKLAFRGLHTRDSKLRGTALEYLESVLPEDVRSKLWPFIEKPEDRPSEESRSRDEILDELLQSNHSIQISLKELRQKQSSSDDSESGADEA